jgi:hypothetical protein
MANNSDKPTPTQEAIEKCKAMLCDEIIAYKAKNEACKIKWESKKEAKQYKICCLVKAQDTYELYTKLDYCVATTAQRDTQLIDERVKKYCAKDDELAKLLKEAVKCIKEVKEKLGAVSDEVCKLPRCKEEEKRCNPDLLKALEKGLGEGKLEAVCDEIKNRSKECYELAVMAFDGGIDVIGIQSFTDLTSLKQLSLDLGISVGAFKKNVDDNIKTASDEIVKNRSELNAILQDLELMRFEKCDAHVEFKGVKGTREFVCNPDCSDCHENRRRLEDLCDKVRKTFNDDSDDEGYDCDDVEVTKPDRPDQKNQEWSM